MNKMVIHADFGELSRAAAAVVLGLSFAAGGAWACGDGKDGLRCAEAPAAPVTKTEEAVVGEVAAKPIASPTTRPTTRPVAKPISENVKKGLAWLVKNQLDNGGWGQGEESRQMGGEGKLKDSANVADTCMAVMALYRSGSTPSSGEYRANTLRALNFICAQIEESDEKSLFITNLRGTRTQGKLGQYIDTFLSAQVLAEVKGQMPDESSGQRVERALAKVIKKIELNQKENGQWVNDGWAPTLAQAACAKALNVASINGVAVNEQVRQRAERYAQVDFAATKAGGDVGAAVSVPASGRVTTLGGTEARGDAGIALYSKSAQLATIQASAQANDAKRDHFNQVLNSPTTKPADREAAQKQLALFDANDRMLGEAQKDVIEKLNDKAFVAGFGSNGGEEFLSYLNIGESLFQKGGADWSKWDSAMTGNLNTIQNADGSWSGHHCITGRTFCTAAALNVLTIDRTPMTVAKADLKK
jgi:hypothetical protein